MVSDIREELEEIAGLVNIDKDAVELAKKVIEANQELFDTREPKRMAWVLPVRGGVRFEVVHPDGKCLDLYILPNGDVRLLTEARVPPEEAPRLMAEYMRLQ